MLLLGKLPWFQVRNGFGESKKGPPDADGVGHDDGRALQRCGLLPRAALSYMYCTVPSELTHTTVYRRHGGYQATYLPIQRRYREVNIPIRRKLGGPIQTPGYPARRRFGPTITRHFPCESRARRSHIE